jgi:hypothetical protein
MKKHIYNKSTGRRYGGYDRRYGKKTVEHRSQRNKARRIVLASLIKKYGTTRAKAMMKGKDVDHKKPIAAGGSNRLSNLRLLDPEKNRGLK